MSATATMHKAAMHDLMGVVCPCGQVKDRRRTFCLACFHRVPRPLRARLAGTRKSEFVPAGYADLYVSALNFLGLESPYLKGER